MLDLHSEILGVAQQYLGNVRPSGSENVMALCPFHDDSSASFAMNTTNGVYFCHACHARGNLFTFLRGMGVPRQVIDLQYKTLIEEARRAIPPKPNPLDPGVFSISPLPEYVLGHFDGYSINSLLSNGFQDRTLRYFDVGYDKWHGRITFPVRDIQGHLVGISGRTIYDGVWPKYKIYKNEYTTWDLPVRGDWDKRKVLYNVHNVYPVLMAHNPPQSEIIVVEGFKACAWVWQAGFKNVVGLLGSYLSWEHRWVLEKFAGKVYLFLDNNAAGIVGTMDAADAIEGRAPKHSTRAGWEVYGSAAQVYVIDYPDRLYMDSTAQPDSLTECEVWEQYYEAKTYRSWLEKKMQHYPESANVR